MSKMPLVCVESPFRGDVERNCRYLAWCVLDSLERGEAPYAGHAIGPLAAEEDEASRRRGLDCDAAFRRVCDVVAIYVDLGISAGMAEGVRMATDAGQHIEYRQLPAKAFANFSIGWYPNTAQVRLRIK